jgi:hypothetical protein
MLNQRENLWNFLGSMVNCFYHQTNFSKIRETQNILIKSFFVIRNIFTDLQQIDFVKRFSLQVLEIYFNFYNLLIYFNNFERSKKIKIINLSGTTSLKSLFLQIDKHLHLLFEPSNFVTEPFSKEAKIRVWKGIKGFHYVNLLNLLMKSETGVVQNNLLQDLVVVKEYFAHGSYFVEAKMIDQLIQVFNGISNIANRTKNYLETRCQMNETLFSSLMRKYSDSKTNRMTLDDLNRCRYQSEIIEQEVTPAARYTKQECATCKRTNPGLFVFCHHCYHCFHFSHLNEMLKNQNYLCEVCFKCECLKAQTVIHFSKTLNLFKIA